MPLVPVRTAARLARRNRSSITRAIEKGRLSATRDENGRYLIDPAELERVFGRLAPSDAGASVLSGSVHECALTDAHLADASVSVGEVTWLREQLERERAERVREQHAFDEERRFLRSLIEGHNEQIRLLNRPASATRRWWRFW